MIELNSARNLFGTTAGDIWIMKTQLKELILNFDHKPFNSIVLHRKLAYYIHM